MPENNQIMSVAGQLVGLPLAGPESFSAQQLDYLKRALGVDETVLWSGSAIDTFPLSESYKNFERIRIHWVDWSNYRCEHVQEFGVDYDFMLTGSWGGANNTIGIFSIYLVGDTPATTLTTQWTRYIALSNTSSVVTTQNSRVVKIVGVNRKSA